MTITTQAGRFPRVRDNPNAKNATVLHFYEPIYQQAVAAGAYVAPPLPANCFALIAWDDLTLHIQTLNNLQLL